MPQFTAETVRESTRQFQTRDEAAQSPSKTDVTRAAEGHTGARGQNVETQRDKNEQVELGQPSRIGAESDTWRVEILRRPTRREPGISQGPTLATNNVE